MLTLKTLVDERLNRLRIGRSHDPTPHPYKILSEFIQNFFSYRGYRQNDTCKRKHYQKHKLPGDSS